VFHRVEVAIREDLPDPAGESLRHEAELLGVRGLEHVRTVRVYVLEGALKPAEVERAARELFADKVVDSWSASGHVYNEDVPDLAAIEVVRKPGVMDPVAASALKGLTLLGLRIAGVRTARRYLFYGALARREAELLASKLLANPVIEDVVFGTPEPMAPPRVSYAFRETRVPIREASDAELERISREGVLSLNLAEMKTVQTHFRERGREPRDVELETIAQTWSEHCVHKTFKGRISFDGEVIDNLLRSTIARATKELDRSWCWSVFEDNAGVVAFDGEWGLAFKVETHNHPSAIEPYGGAGTGIGGVIRDILGTGLGARPIANTDIFCFGPANLARDKVPRGCLHPRRVMKGVVAGVRDYGNRMGIPTVNGAVYFDERYIGNPLVYCGTLGLIERKYVHKGARPGDLVIVAGGRVGRDGIHGATFSSVELSEDSEMLSSGAVQIGNAIEEKKVLDVMLEARDQGLYTAVTDCGAGGLSSAVGEMGRDTGALVYIERVPLKYEGLSYTEIWISEAQERMVFAVPPEKKDAFLALFTGEDVEATVIGKFTHDRMLRLTYEGEEVCELDMDFLHEGIPQLVREACWDRPRARPPRRKAKKDHTPDLLAILAGPNVASKEWIVRQYDHEVQAATAIKPLVGAGMDGPGDAAVLVPLSGSGRAVAVACGMNPRLGDLDPYAMAAHGIDEAVRNCVAVGARPDRIALLDNFCWGNTDKPEQLGPLVLASRACYDLAMVYGTPFISGKDSLNNEYATGTGTIAIPHTLLISAIGLVDDVMKCVTMDAKKAGDLVYLVGATRPEMGGSHYDLVNDLAGGTVPAVSPEESKAAFEAMHRAISARHVASCHDLSEGGLAVAAAETAFAGSLGMKLDLAAVPVDGEVTALARLFAETPGRFLVTVHPGSAAAFEEAAEGARCARIGEVTSEAVLEIGTLVRAPIGDLKAAWGGTFRW